MRLLLQHLLILSSPLLHFTDSAVDEATNLAFGRRVEVSSRHPEFADPETLVDGIVRGFPVKFRSKLMKERKSGVTNVPPLRRESVRRVGKLESPVKLEQALNSFSTKKEPNPWVQIDLGDSKDVDVVEIHHCPANDSDDRIFPFRILIGAESNDASSPSGNSCGGVKGTRPTQPPIVVPCGGMRGRFVSLVVDGDGRETALQLDEIAVMGIGRRADVNDSDETVDRLRLRRAAQPSGADEAKKPTQPPPTEPPPKYDLGVERLPSTAAPGLTMTPTVTVLAGNVPGEPIPPKSKTRKGKGKKGGGGGSGEDEEGFCSTGCFIFIVIFLAALVGFLMLVSSTVNRRNAEKKEEDKNVNQNENEGEGEEEGEDEWQEAMIFGTERWRKRWEADQVSEYSWNRNVSARYYWNHMMEEEEGEGARQPYRWEEVVEGNLNENRRMSKEERDREEWRKRRRDRRERKRAKSDGRERRVRNGEDKKMGERWTRRGEIEREGEVETRTEERRDGPEKRTSRESKMTANSSTTTTTTTNTTRDGVKYQGLKTDYSF